MSEMAEPAFPTSLRRDPEDPRGLRERIDTQITERIEEALNFYVMDLLVTRRARQGRPAPAHGNPSDQREFQMLLKEFLAVAERDLRSAAAMDPPPSLGQRGDRQPYPLAWQTYYATHLPDYWQRLDAIMANFATAHLEKPPRRTVREIFKRLFWRLSR